MENHPRSKNSEGQAEMWALFEGQALREAWRVLPKRPERVEPPPSPSDSQAELYYLGEPGHAKVRKKPKAEVPLNPAILGNRLEQRRPWGERGELYLWLPAVDAMDRDAKSPVKILIDPSPDALEPRFDSEIRPPMDPERHRVCPNWFNKGYKEVEQNLRKMGECRRQLSLRTDLSKVVYGRIPHPDRLMLPISNGVGGPFDESEIELPPAGLEAEALEITRFEDDPLGPRPHPSSAYFNPMIEPNAPEIRGVSPLNTKGLRPVSPPDEEVQP